MSSSFSVDRELLLLQELCEVVATRLDQLSTEVPAAERARFRRVRAEALGLGDEIVALANGASRIDDSAA
jgi:hypothetical protein